MHQRLKDFRDNFAGPWPRALSFFLLVAMGGPLVSAIIFFEPPPVQSFVASTIFAIFASALAIVIKRRTSDHD